ncbi:hypothetical protein Acidovoranil_21510 [Acidovorax sp. FG27]
MVERGALAIFSRPAPQTVSITLTGDRRYVGFWWSAGDASNVIKFYDTSNHLLAEFTTASLVAVLSGNGSITAIDGRRYPKASYFGNPNANQDTGGARSNPAEPYGYINLLLQGTSVRFGRIEVSGQNFELDNVAVADVVSIDRAWVDYGTQQIALPPGAVGANNDSSATSINTPVSGNAATNDTAPAGSRWSKTSEPSPGTVVQNSDGTYVYTPATGFAGVDSYGYQVCKPAPNAGECATALVRITVGIDAVDDAVSTRPDTPVSSAVAANDQFPAGATFGVSASPARGTVTMDPATGGYTYSPNAGVVGTDSFQYRLCLPAPNETQCDTATVTVGISNNAAPVASAVTITGTPRQATMLTGTYAYSDGESDAQSTSTFRWVRSASASTAAGGLAVGAARTYTPSAADVGQFLFFCVTPRAQTGATPGAEVCTAAAAANGGPALRIEALPASPVPTLSQWAVALMASLLALCAAARLRRRG